MGYAELIRRVPHLPADADRYSQRIVEVLQRGSAMTQEVMNFGKDSPVTPRVIEIPAIVESMSGMFRVLLGSIRLHVHHEPAVSRVFIDASQLERVLLNLVLNARDAMPGGGDLTITTRDTVTDDEDGESATFVAITIADTGVGMDAATRENVFKPFFTTKGSEGTGLGLAIVDQIVLRAGGFIRLDSEVGRGTTLSIFLPRIAAAL